MRDYHFNTEKGIFTIKRTDIPKEWMNVLVNDYGYTVYLTHLGNTMSVYTNERAEKVNLNPFSGTYTYLQDDETGVYWNTADYPSLNGVKNYQCEHGQLFTRISSVKEGIFSTLTFVLAPDDASQIHRITLKNTTDKMRKINVYQTVYFDLDGYANPRYFSAKTASYTKFYPDCNTVLCKNLNIYRPHEQSSGFVACNREVVEYAGNPDVFFGVAGSHSKPWVLERGLPLSPIMAAAKTRGGVLKTQVELAPNEEKIVYFLLGLTTGVEEIRRGYAELTKKCDEICSRAEDGENVYGHLRTECPEPAINHVMNFWAEHQVNFCMLGKKAVRDNAQLGMAMLNFNVAVAKKTIDECLAHEYANGRAVLTWFPYLERNVYSDPSAWLAQVVCEYVKETGDFDYLDQVIPYLDEEKSGTVKEHLKKIVEWYERGDNYGPNGLPRIHVADWNDALNIPDEQAESVFLGMQICKTYGELEKLFAYIGEFDYANELKENKRRLSAKINAVAFNGDYYVRAFSKFGVVGDKDGLGGGGKIYANPQSWSILSGVCPEDRRDKVLATIDNLETEEGVPLCSPAYKEYDERVGRMSAMLAGIYENGGIYNHAGCFKAFADCMLGRGEQAVNTLLKIIPEGKNPTEITYTEPYVFTNCYLKHENENLRGGGVWQTGSSAWGIIVYYEGILGLRRDYEGLKINPCIPKSWKKVWARREYRGNVLNITYKNQGGKQVELEVDGRKISGNILPKFDDDDEHQIKVVLK